MKKNKAMRAAGVLLIATMLTTCMTAGTFAKYTTTDSATDSARVAKFGVVVTANGSLFGEEYAAADANTPIGYTGNTNTGTVQVADAGTNVVAPGTKNDMGMGFAVSGTPEVDVNVTLNVTKAKNVRMNAGAWGAMVSVDTLVTAENFADYKADVATPLYTLATNEGVRTFTKVVAADNFAAANDYYQLHDQVLLADAYYPVQFSLATTNGSSVNGATDADSLAAVVDAYGDAVGAADFANAAINTTKTYQANTNLANATDDANAPGLGLDDAKITWAWAFANDGKNAADTILGDLMAGSDDHIIVYNANATAANNATFTALTADDAVAANANFDNPEKAYNLYTALDMSITVEQVD